MFDWEEARAIMRGVAGTIIVLLCVLWAWTAFVSLGSVNGRLEDFWQDWVELKNKSVETTGRLDGLSDNQKTNDKALNDQIAKLRSDLANTTAQVSRVCIKNGTGGQIVVPCSENH